MDQLKEIMKQAVKYRFWIAIGFSILLPLIGYFVGSGGIKELEKKATDDIVSTDKGVATYLQSGLPNDQYPPLVNDKKTVLAEDVTKAWEKLYKRQAPLLKWPEIVEERFHTWGRKWPEDVDKGAVQQAIGDYVLAYDKSVEATYKKVNPWMPLEGTGIVVVPEMAMLLRPAVFDVAKPPDLGKVWASQERLWIQGTLLDAVANINGKAKDWDGAIVKQISAMEVGSPAAQDQKSMAKGETVEVAPSLDPGGEAAAASAPAAADPMASAMMAAMGGGMGSGAAAATEDVYYLKTESSAYKVLPVQMTVLVDQNRLQDFFIGLENSPMAIQVMEFELQKPLAPVTKPVKGESNFGGMYGSGGSEGMSSMMEMMRSNMGRGMGSGMGMMNAGGMDPASMMQMMRGGMYGGGTAAPAKKGVDNRTKDAKKDREKKEAERNKAKRVVDLYYDIVQVTVYGQARFYNPPPPAAPSESTASTTPAEPTDAKPADAAKADAPADPGAPAAKVADPGAPAAAKADETKADETKAADPAAPKADTKPADAPKAEAKPADAPKGDSAPKADAKPPDTPAPKAGAAKP